MSAERMKEISRELLDLTAELESLQARALHRVEELENWKLEHGFKFPWTPEVKENFLILQRLISKV